MSDGTVVYLHGMGGARPTWADPLGLHDVATIAPHYADLLEPDTAVYAQRRVPAATAEATTSEREAYVDRQRALADALQSVGEAVPRGTSWPSVFPHPARLPDRLPLPKVLRTPLFGIDQVGRYLDDESRRAAVIDRARAALAAARPPVVVLAHSLGSVVMVDMLSDLPCDIDLLITLGSPLGHEAVFSAVPVGPFPYGRIGGWVNVVHLLDPVPFGRGLADRQPAALDTYLPVLAGSPSALAALPWLVSGIARAATAHLDSTYLSSETVRAAVRIGLDRQARPHHHARPDGFAEVS